MACLASLPLTLRAGLYLCTSPSQRWLTAGLSQLEPARFMPSTRSLSPASDIRGGPEARHSCTSASLALQSTAAAALVRLFHSGRRPWGRQVCGNVG